LLLGNPSRQKRRRTPACWPEEDLATPCVDLLLVAAGASRRKTLVVVLKKVAVRHATCSENDVTSFYSGKNLSRWFLPT
jgi:hypothetical protein